MACSASGKSFGRGPCPRWPAGREHCPPRRRRSRIPPVGKREELRTRTARRSDQREETGGNGGLSSLFLDLRFRSIVLGLLVSEFKLNFSWKISLF